jgi:hypothetical protein
LAKFSKIGVSRIGKALAIQKIDTIISVIGQYQKNTGQLTNDDEHDMHNGVTAMKDKYPRIIPHNVTPKDFMEALNAIDTAVKQLDK